MYDELVKRLRKLSGTDNLSEFDEAADAIEELSKQHEQQRQNLIALMNEKPRWISVEEALPKESERVLVACEDGVSFGFFEEIIADDEFVKEWHDMMYYPISVTHWMPLPSTEGLNET